MNVSRPDSSGQKKRNAWAHRSNTDAYLAKMGDYAVRRDEEIIAAMVGTGTGVLLDLPCGTGRHIDNSRSRGFTVIAADFSPTMLSTAKERHDTHFVRADIFTPPFRPEIFDVILISRLMFHYSEPEKLLGCVLPYLKPNGRIVFDTLNRFSLRWLASQVLFPIYYTPQRRLYFESPLAFEKKLSLLGLQVLERKSIYVLPTRVYRFLPESIVRAIHALESLIPQSLRVLSYWDVCKKQTK